MALGGEIIAPFLGVGVSWLPRFQAFLVIYAYYRLK